MSSLPYPSQPRISSVCSPRRGERFTSAGESESLIGEHTDEILDWLGYGKDDIKVLHEEGAV